MSQSCNHDCASCKENCEQRDPKSFLVNHHPNSNIQSVVGVVSGKGGVGKSLVTSLLAVTTNKMGLGTAIMDADITGPSIPKVFGIKEKATGNEHGIYPVTTPSGIEVMSMNLILENDDDPVIWRGPVIAGTVTQFWTDVVYENADVLYIDMPPGTGDVTLTVFQSIPLTGIVIVTSPQDLVSMIVAKAVNMAKLMNVPILGIVENYSYYECEDCHKRVEIFGQSKVEEVAKKFGINTVVKLPLDPKLAKLCDEGKIELYDKNDLQPIVETLLG